MIDYNQLSSEYLFGLSKMDILQKCLISEFPGTSKWPANNPIWECNIYNKKSPKEAWNDENMLLAAINNIFYITKKCISENKNKDFINRIKTAFYCNDKELLEVILNRFTIAKIAPKVTALQPSAFERILEESKIDISSGIYCPMAGFGGIVEGAKRYYKKHHINAEIEAYDINPDFCNYYGWIKRDLLAQKIKTNKIVFVCPPFGEKTERWKNTPDNMYYSFETWVSLIKEHIDAPNYIFVGPEIGNKRKEQNPNIKSGLFSKKYGIQYYPEYSL